MKNSVSRAGLGKNGRQSAGGAVRMQLVKPDGGYLWCLLSKKMGATLGAILEVIICF